MARSPTAIYDKILHENIVRILLFSAFSFVFVLEHRVPKPEAQSGVLFIWYSPSDRNLEHIFLLRLKTSSLSFALKIPGSGCVVFLKKALTSYANTRSSLTLIGQCCSAVECLALSEGR